jgi:hypothetical protein
MRIVNNNIFTQVLFFLFTKLHGAHFNQEWNNKKRLKLIEIRGIRTALVDDLSQRTVITFYWKIGKWYI